MSTSAGAALRRHPRDHRIAAAAALPVVFAALVMGVASADPPPGVVRLSADDAERAGSTIRLMRQSLGGSTLVEVEPTIQGSTLLAVSPDGTVAALADRLGDASGALTLADLDGAQLQVRLPGILSASFADDGTWLALVDGRGGLWRVDAGSGASDRLSDGPFIGSPIIGADGSLMLLAVPSVEAPYRSQLVRLDPGTGEIASLSDEDLVYGAFPTGGGLAIVAHTPEGTVVKRLRGDGATSVADLGQGAVNVAVAPDGRIAFERDGQGVFLVAPPDAAERRIADGSRPCFAADGSVLLVRREDQSVAIGLDGSVLASVGDLASFAGIPGCAS
jgi:hypothetical protein